MSSKAYKYLYEPEMYIVFPDKTKIKVNVINKLTKQFNYALTFFPIYECDCLVPLKYMTKIRTNQDTLYVILTIKKIKYKANGTSLKSEKTEIVLNHAFVPFFTPDSFNSMVSSEQENPTDSNSPNTTYNTGAATSTHLKFSLFSIAGLAANKKILNYVADECDVGTMIKFLIEQTDIESCIIDKPDNEDTYKNLIVTPHNLKTALDELQVRYGIYANGLSTFYDPPVLYVMNKFTLNHDHEKDKPNKLIFKCYVKNANNIIGYSNALENDDKSIEYTVSCAPKPTNEDLVASEIEGNEIIFSNITLTTNMMTFKDGKVDSFNYPTTSLTSDIMNHKKTGNRSLVDYDDTNNPYNISAFLKSKNLGTLVTIPLIFGVDLDTFKPNTSITITVVDDKERDAEFSGLYSVLSGSIEYTRSRPDDSSMVCAVRDLLLSRMDSE